MSGWICLHRDIQQHWLFNFDEPEKFMAWTDLILSANHQDNKFLLKGQVVECKRGQVAMSQVTLSKRWKWSRPKVQRFLEMLKNDAMIDVKGDHLTSIITICNYSIYQNKITTDVTTDVTADVTPDVTADVTQTTNKQINKETKKQIKDVSDSQEAFERFYSAYPKKIDRKGAEKSWKKIKPEMYEIIIADVINRSANHEGWIEKKYINAPAVYLNNERWNDEIWLKKIPTQQINKSQQKFTNNTNTALSVFNKLTGVDYEQTRSSNFLENIDIDSRDL